MPLLFGSTEIGRRIDVYIELFPIDNAMSQCTGCHDIDESEGNGGDTFVTNSLYFLHRYAAYCNRTIFGLLVAATLYTNPENRENTIFAAAKLPPIQESHPTGEKEGAS